MFGEGYTFQETGEFNWGKSVFSRDILQKLSGLECSDRKEESNQFSKFFQIRPSELVWNISSTSTLSKDGLPLTNRPTCHDTEANIGGSEGKMDTDVAESSLDAEVLVLGSQDPILDVVCSLEEQTARSEQLIGLSDEELTLIFSKLSDTGICHICALICQMSACAQSRFGYLVCRGLLLPRLQEKTGDPRSRGVVKAVAEFTRSFPHLSCNEVLLPLMLSTEVSDGGKSLLQIITEALGPDHQENLLRSYLEHEPSKIEEWQIPVIQKMLSTTCGDIAGKQLIQLMSSSATDMARNNHFGKLLISVIQTLGPGAPPNILQQLSALVSCNKSLLKRAAEKALQAL